jgi:uncharacterized iron-regulated membrane protein
MKATSMQRITEAFWLLVVTGIVGLTALVVIGAGLTWVTIWLQQFGNTASAQSLRDEQDRKRKAYEQATGADKRRNNPTHS